MPSAAQQDYILIECLDRPFGQDVGSLKRLKQVLNHGTIFDVIIRGRFQLLSSEIRQSRIMALRELQKDDDGGDSAQLVYYSSEPEITTPTVLSINDTERHYDVLEYIQKECDIINGSPVQNTISLQSREIEGLSLVYVNQAEVNAVIASEDGFAYMVEYNDDDYIVNVTKSSVSVEEAKAALDVDNVIILPEDKALELIGMDF